MSIDINLFSGLIGALIGGAISGGASIFAVYKTEEHNRAAQSGADTKVLKGLLQALHDELESIFERYEETMGIRVEALSEGDALLAYYPVINDFFTVYNANAFLIGRIENNDLRRSLVRTYVLAKGLVDSFRMNNELLSKYEHWYFLSRETGSAIHQEQARVQLGTLKEYGRLIKKSHGDLKACKNELMRMLHKQGVLQER